MSFALTSCLLAALTSGTSDLQPLLDRIAEHLAHPLFSRFEQTETEEDLDRQGKVTSVRRTTSEHEMFPDGTSREEVLEAIEDGYEVTGKVRRFREERERKSKKEGRKPRAIDVDVDIELKLPFDASQQPEYTFTRVGGDATTPRIHFEPKGERRRKWVGDAVVDAATGVLLEVHGRPAVMPQFVDDLRVDMKFDDHVETGDIPARMVIEGQGHFLFFHKRMRYTSVCSDFRPPGQ